MKVGKENDFPLRCQILQIVILKSKRKLYGTLMGIVHLEYHTVTWKARG